MILHGDCIELMAEMEADSVDAIVTDPPYGLEFMGKEWDKLNPDRLGFHKGKERDFIGIQDGTPMRRHRGTPAFSSQIRGFVCDDCGKYQGGNPKINCTCEHPKFRARSRGAEQEQFYYTFGLAAFRVLKPGGSLLSFGGTRTHHRLMCGLEDAGFIIKDCLMWLYGQGFPKAQDLGKMIDKRLGAEREVINTRSVPDMRGDNYAQGKSDYTPLEITDSLPASDLARHWDGYKIGGIKPAWESILWATKPFNNTEVLDITVRNLIVQTEVLECWIKRASVAARDSVLSLVEQVLGSALCGAITPPKESVSTSARAETSDSSEKTIPRGKAAGSPAVTVTSYDRWTADNALSILSSWKNTLAGLLNGTSRFTTSMVSEMITDLRTCDSSLSAAMPVCTTQDGTTPSGGVLSVANAVVTSIAAYMKWSDTLTTSAPASAISSPLEAALSTLDGSPVRPDWSPIIWAVKPPEGAWIDNVLKYGTGAVNVDECRVDAEPWTRKGLRDDIRGDNFRLGETRGRVDLGGIAESHPKGRFPANLLLDESAAALLDEQSGACGSSSGYVGEPTTDDGGSSWRKGEHAQFHYSDNGGASRFFYTSKATDRQPYNDHPTLKPTDLIEWLIRLVTRPGQTVLDPFAGSGTTGVAAIHSAREFILIEQDEHYISICKRRTTENVQGGMF